MKTLAGLSSFSIGREEQDEDLVKDTTSVLHSLMKEWDWVEMTSTQPLHSPKEEWDQL